MLSRSALSSAARRCGGAVVTRSFGDSAAGAASSSSTVKLNFSLPHETIYDGAPVQSVILPGSAGEYGVTANHVPYVAQLKPGVVQILHDDGAGTEPEKYFVAGGYALTHEDSSTDVVCPEAVKLDDIDASEVSRQFEAAKSAFGSAAAGSVEQAEAQIDMEVNRAMGLAVGLNLS